MPILGVCLGIQLMTRASEEGTSSGLGWLPARTVRFGSAAGDRALPVPHMGWSSVAVRKPGPLFDSDTDTPRFYFVHSYYVVCDDPADVLATTVYGHEFVSAFQRGNIFGVQFHQEKSHRFGMRLIKNFLERV